ETSRPPRLLMGTIHAFMQPVPDRSRLAEGRRLLRVGEPFDLEETLRWLVEHGYEAADVVDQPAQFGRRGGTLAIFSGGAVAPVRIELFGDEIESLRQFSPQTQRSLAEVQSAEITVLMSPHMAMRGLMTDYLPQGTWVALVEPQELEDQGRQY